MTVVELRNYLIVCMRTIKGFSNLPVKTFQELDLGKDQNKEKDLKLVLKESLRTMARIMVTAKTFRSILNESI